MRTPVGAFFGHGPQRKDHRDLTLSSLEPLGSGRALIRAIDFYFAFAHVGRPALNTHTHFHYGIFEIVGEQDFETGQQQQQQRTQVSR
jgi:hypothetical protein